ncbi:MAG: Rrf2 family transcriptional regulator [Lentisphaeria bacterium]|jgi:Rrf2 family protein
MLMVSQKCQYAVRAMFELAKRHGGEPTKIEEIATAQAIPQRFLANILNQLRAAGLVDSVRGKKGGYVLPRPPAQTSVGDVIRLMEGSLAPVDCRGAGRSRCPLVDQCIFVGLWQRAQDATTKVYDGTSFQDLLEEERRLLARRGKGGFDYVI